MAYILKIILVGVIYKQNIGGEIMTKDFTIEDTNYSKGVAMCLMIVHHLFFNVTNMGVNVYNMEIWQKVGILSKVCVAIFLILSGYGIDQGTKNGYKIKGFYKKRFLKLYTNYWFTISISFIVGFLFFYDKFVGLLGKNALLKIAYNYTGLQFITGYPGYNGAWWFITVTIILYLLFPLIDILIKKYNYIFLAFAAIFLFPDMLRFDLLNLKWIAFWFFPFILGIFISRNDMFKQLNMVLDNKRWRYITAVIIILLFVIIVPTRLRLGMTFAGYALDTLFALLIIITNYLYLSKIKIQNEFLICVGKYSMDMFLIHGFITTLYIAGFIYSLKYPLLMIMVVLLLSLFIAILLSKMKMLLKIS